MKRKLIAIPVLALLLICSAFRFAHKGLDQAMTKMMDKMKSMKMSDDPDYDFATMMAEHHQGAIDMSRIVVKEGKNEQIKTIALDILDTQRRQQKRLELYASKDDNSKVGRNEGSTSSAEKPEKSFSVQMHTALRSLESSISDMKMTNNVDHDFAMMMIAHHRSAIEMSEVILSHGKNDGIKKIAEKIISDSEKDIKQLRSWLESRK